MLSTSIPVQRRLAEAGISVRSGRKLHYDNALAEINGLQTG